MIINRLAAACSCACVLISLTLAAACGAADSRPQWIWQNEQRDGAGNAFFRKTFSLDRGIRSATLHAVGDFCRLRLYVNGTLVADVEDYSPRADIDIARQLKPGENLLAVEAHGSAGPSAIAVWLDLAVDEKSAPDAETTLVTGGDWIASASRQPGWQQPDLRPINWGKAVGFGPLADEPWLDTSDRIAIGSFDDYTQWKQALSAGDGADPLRFQVPPGFEIERIRSALPEEDSWVAMATDAQGRLIIAKEQKGLLRMTLSADGRTVDTVETIDDELLECRGLLFVENDLYVNANNSKALYRLRDTDGDDAFDERTLIYASTGGVGHGRNDLTLGPDGAVYSIQGDSVDLPPTEKMFFDRTSPYREFRRGAKTSEGHVIRFKPQENGGDWEIVASGLRNPFGIDFHRDEEMFTYDADAEHDMGAPWYRPTRVDHLVSGADFGWRGVTGSWPPYYPDHPDNAPSSFDIGKGSPTAVKFGYASGFPGKYREALYILDWAYGRILAVHLAPRGGSYAMSAETFVKGRPFNVTDIDFAADGSMYAVTGGRKTQAALYRIRYTGPDARVPKPELGNEKRAAAVPKPELGNEAASLQQQARSEFSQQARQRRRELEAFHGRQDGRAVDAAWPNLAHPDPSIRHAARIALEHQPVEKWENRALEESDRLAAATALMALARSTAGDADENRVQRRSRILDRLNQLPLAEFTHSPKLAALWAYDLCLVEPERFDRALLDRVIEKLDPLYPDSSVPGEQAWQVNRQLSTLLVRLHAPGVVGKTMPLLAAAAKQEQQLHLLFVLRNVKQGWTLDARRLYFATLGQGRYFVMGQGMPDFLKRIRDEALATLSDEERASLGTFLAENDPAAVVEAEPLPDRPLVREWTLDDLQASLASSTAGSPAATWQPDFERGERMFAAALCVRCHRFGARGHALGPDLTSVASRFSRRDMLESILEPSKVVAEPYRSVQVVTTDGQVHTGRVIPGGDFRLPVLKLATDPLQPQKIVEIDKSKIESYEISPLSVMPKGLLNTLSQAEILDLLAYLQRGASRE